ncbi:MAG: glucuronate isomerase [Firmicutes bacterium]|nr:glucuronate isomerase [Bacillota bacterium]
MKEFMDDKFLLNSETAITLFNHVKNLPIVDYHCHLIPKEIAEDKHFTNITDLALGGDHYKWRLMRANGVDEKYITGDAGDDEKFHYWCATIEDCIGSPLYHWTHLEMRRYFDYDGPITGDLSGKIYAHCNAIIAKGDFSAWNIFKKFHVAQIGTTDDPADDLQYHKQMIENRKHDSKLPLIQPTFRPSKVQDITSPNFVEYIKTLSTASGVNITNRDTLHKALNNRLDFFHEMGCRCSDNALDPPVFVQQPGIPQEADAILQKALSGGKIDQNAALIYQTDLMVWLGKAYNARGWAMQLHMGAQRNNNTLMIQKLGADTGYDSMSDESFSRPLAKLLDALEMENALPKTILYALNPTADTMLATMIGNFQGGGIKGKMQWGSAWWFNDTKLGMQKHLRTLADCGMLARFIGMLTDSRSFMSYPRHEYFRRILAQVIADWVDNGEFPNDMPRLKKIMEDICYNNVVEYLGIEK